MLFLFMLINFADKTVLGLSALPIMEELGLNHSSSVWWRQASSRSFACGSARWFPRQPDTHQVDYCRHGARLVHLPDAHDADHHVRRANRKSDVVGTCQARRLGRQTSPRCGKQGCAPLPNSIGGPERVRTSDPRCRAESLVPAGSLTCFAFGPLIAIKCDQHSGPEGPNENEQRDDQHYIII